VLRRQTWPDWSLAHAINARYQGNKIQASNVEEEKEMFKSEQCSMTAVKLMENVAVCGSQFGDLYLFHFDALRLDKTQVIDFKTESLGKLDMALTRGFSAHVSMIESLEVYENQYLFSTSQSDQCII